MRFNLPVSGRELTLPADINLLSTTALDGTITYANAAFIEVCGYTEAELIGQPHNLIRHPDMPAAAFADLWQTLQAGRSWMGLVKNRCKNGDHYWVNAYVTPILHNGRPVEYQSVRTAASAEQVRAGEALYAVLHRGDRLHLAGLPLDARLALVNLGLAVTASPLAYLLGGAAAAGLLAGFGVLQAAALLWQLRPLQRLAQRAEAITCNPLASYLYSGRRDALGRIDFALFSREAELRAVMGRVADSVHQMDPMLANLKDAVDSSRQATQRQHRETERVAVAIEEMVNSMQAVSGSTRDSAQSVSAVERETRSGLDQAGHTRMAMVQLADQVGQASQVIDQLQNHSHEINKALEMIEEVAEQTNLLALNAAIEAARAGEAGRGFAVVADEVRALARRTQGSTQDIQSIIRALQQKAGAAVEVMLASRDQTGDGLAQVSRVTTDLQAVRGQVSQLHAMSQQIAAATQAQGQACDDVQSSIEQIRQACEHNVGTSEHSQHCAAAVAGQALRLQGLVEQFALRTR